MAHTFYTLGHSTRSIEELIQLLVCAGADMIVDVRTIPRSRTNPQFNQDTLPRSLAVHHIGYEHIAALGGLRGSSGKTDSPNTYWDNRSFRNYADYAMGEKFHAGLARLRALGREHTCAIMCAEAVWWRCHRRIIADYLLVAGERVLHIMAPGRFEPAHLTPAAQVNPAGVLEYRRAGTETPGPGIDI